MSNICKNCGTQFDSDYCPACGTKALQREDVESYQAPQTHDNAWYTNIVVILLLLLCFYPVGLFLMWKYTDWNRGIKIVVTIVLILCSVFSIYTTYNLGAGY